MLAPPVWHKIPVGREPFDFEKSVDIPKQNLQYSIMIIFPKVFERLLFLLRDLWNINLYLVNSKVDKIGIWRFQTFQR